MYDYIELIENSLFLKYWKYLVTLIAFILTIIYLKNKVKYNKKVVNNVGKKLAEEEYIGEFQDDDNEKLENDLLEPFLDENEHLPYAGATITLNGGAEKFYDICNNRRSVRKYSRKSIDINIIKKCIECAGTSPSGAHTEPWTYCLITDSNVKQTIRQIIEEEEYKNYKHRMSRQWTTDLRPLKTNYIKEYLTDAPYLILVFKQIYGIRPDGKKQQHYYNEISVAISTGILLCALQAAGLNSLITTPLNCGPAIRTLLNRPKNEKLLVLLPVGYAAADCLVPDLKRKTLTDIMIEY